VDDQRHETATSETALTWESVRRIREPIAWTLLFLTGVGLLIGVWQLLGFNGAPVALAPSPGPVAETTFAFRASVVGPEFVGFGITALPVLSVILVVFTHGLTDRARQVVKTAASIQAVGLALGGLSWLAAVGAHDRSGVWVISFAVDLAVAAAALIFTAAVLRSKALRTPKPQFQDVGQDDEDFGADDAYLGTDDEDVLEN